MIVDVSQCLDAVDALKEDFNPADGGAYRAQTDGSGFCTKCTGCGHNVITYMLDYKSDEMWANYICVHYCSTFNASLCDAGSRLIDDADTTPGVDASACCVGAPAMAAEKKTEEAPSAPVNS